MFEVMVTLIKKNGRLNTEVKTFKTEKARASWIDKKWNAGEIYEIRAYRDGR